MALESRTEPRYAGRLRRVGARYSASGMEVPDEARRREGRVKQGGNTEAFLLSVLEWKTIREEGFFHACRSADVAACALNGKRCGGAENLRDVFPYPYTERDARDCKNGGLPDSELYALVCERG